MTPRHALLCLIVVSGCLRLIWAGSTGLGHDEAYHYLFSVHRDWSYFDHPPMLAVVESIGPALFGSSAPMALRFGFVLLFAGSTWLLFRLTARSFGDRAGLMASLAINISAYHTAAAGAFALPDGPLLFFWLLTLDRIDLALRLPERTRLWLFVGRGVVEQVSRGLLAGGHGSLSVMDSLGTQALAEAGAVSCGGHRRRHVLARPLVER